MWIPDKIVELVDAQAVVRYVGRDEANLWNRHRRPGELSLFCGWSWFARTGSRNQRGLKSQSAAYRDAYYTLVASQPKRPSLKLVAQGGGR
jgi:hypothetical protein